MGFAGVVGHPIVVVAALPLHDATVDHLSQVDGVLELVMDLCEPPSDALPKPQCHRSGKLRFLHLSRVGVTPPWQPCWREPDWGIEVLSGRASASREGEVELILQVHRYGTDESRIVRLQVTADDAEWVPSVAVIGEEPTTAEIEPAEASHVVRGWATGGRVCGA
ncbi:hypothetical protein ABZV60_26470 [Streptomyces sp. NPDC004787]|uniref:hypothetical protein n=1 Tax=Streptomyces sp. NPDC004787 TaxID=3154291 RepID=UPI00339E3538